MTTLALFDSRSVLLRNKFSNAFLDDKRTTFWKRSWISSCIWCIIVDTYRIRNLLIQKWFERYRRMDIWKIQVFQCHMIKNRKVNFLRLTFNRRDRYYSIELRVVRVPAEIWKSYRLNAVIYWIFILFLSYFRVKIRKIKTHRVFNRVSILYTVESQNESNFFALKKFERFF